nr:ABC transporter permease [uncultured Anaerostipes sp.]
MKQWKTIIEPKTRLLDLPLREIWQYRGLIFMLVKRNYEIQYKQTILGPGWMIINPILSSGLFSLIFGYVGNFSSDGIPYFLFCMSATIIWNYFAGCVTSNTSIFLANAYLFGKVYFPRMVVPISNVIFEFIRFFIQFIVCCLVWLYFFIQGQVAFTGWYLLGLVILVFETALLGMAVGMIVSSLTTKYRDLTHLVGFGMQLLMYLAPVLYPISDLPRFLQKIVLINPMASIVEAFRFAMTGAGDIHWFALLYSTVFAVVAAFGSMILYNQTEKTFIDIV